jgi:hypothetical protein
MPMNPCRCRGSGRLWCWLDWLTLDRIAAICDRHEAWITKETPCTP